MPVVGIAGVVVVAAVCSPGVVLGAVKDIVTVKVEATLIVPALIRRALKAQTVVRSAWRPDAVVDLAMNGSATVARGATAPMAPLLRS